MGINDAWINAKDYPTIQAAIDAVPAGVGTALIPPGVFTSTSTPAMTALTVPDGVTLRGSGSRATELRYDIDAGAAITMRGSRVRLLDLWVRGPGSGTNAIGVLVGKQNSVLSDNVIDGVHVSGMGKWSVYVAGDNDPIIGGAGTGNITTAIRDCQLVDVQSPSGGHLYVGHAVTTVWVSDSYLHAGTGHMLYSAGLNGCSFRSCAFESSGNTNPLVHIEAAVGATFDGCWFETHGACTQYALEANGYGIVVRGCFLGREAGSPVRFAKVSGRSILIDSPVARTTDDPTDADDILIDVGTDPVAQVTVIGGFKFNLAETYSGQFTVSGDAARVAKLNTGYRISVPRVTEDGRLNGPETVRNGDIIYQHDGAAPGFYKRDEGAWVKF